MPILVLYIQLRHFYFDFIQLVKVSAVVRYIFDKMLTRSNLRVVKYVTIQHRTVKGGATYKLDFRSSS